MSWRKFDMLPRNGGIKTISSSGQVTVLDFPGTSSVKWCGESFLCFQIMLQMLFKLFNRSHHSTFLIFVQFVQPLHFFKLFNCFNSSTCWNFFNCFQQSRMMMDKCKCEHLSNNPVILRKRKNEVCEKDIWLSFILRRESLWRTMFHFYVNKLLWFLSCFLTLA